MSNIEETRPYLRKLFQNVKVGDVMMTPAISIHETDNFSVAQEKFVDQHLTHICVVNDAGHLVGLISQKYLYKAQSPRKIFGEELEYDPDIIIDGDSFYDKEVLDSYMLPKIMSRDPFTMKIDQPLEDAIFNMANKRLGCVPIIDDKDVLRGVLTDQLIVKFLSTIL